MAASIATSFAGATLAAPRTNVSTLSPGQAHAKPSLHSGHRTLKGIRCQSDISSIDNEDQTGNTTRRHTLISLAGLTAVGSLGSLSLTGDANAADLIQRIQRGDFLSLVQGKLRVAVKENSELVPELLRLALNDALTYEKASSSGGANGSIHFGEELERPENKGLEKAVKLLESVKADIDEGAKGGPISWADIIQFGGQAAVKRLYLEAAIRKAGGDEAKGRQLYFAFGSASQWGLFDKQFGRADATEADPAGRVPDWSSTSVEEWKAKLAPYGLKPRQLVVLSAFLDRDILAVEEKLANDSEAAPFVKKYQKSRESISQTDYEVDLITTFTKIAQFGAPITYEAYTFVPPRRNIRF